MVVGADSLERFLDSGVFPVIHIFYAGTPATVSGFLPSPVMKAPLTSQQSQYTSYSQWSDSLVATFTVQQREKRLPTGF